MAKLIGDTSLDTTPGTYLYALAQHGSTFATIGSDDSLRFFDGSLNLLQKVSSAHAGISCLSSFGTGYATAGRDGQVRCWDLRAKKAASDIAEPKGAGISALACHENLIAVGTESTSEGLGDVSVLLYDARNPSVPMRRYVESHTDSITQLAFHPSQPNVLLSGSTDGLISLFDISQAEEEDAIQQVLNPRSAVHCAGFLSASEVYVLTTDEHFSVYNLSQDTSGSALDFGDVRQMLGCTYVVDIVNSARPPAMVFGNHERSALGIVPLDEGREWAFGPRMELPGAHGEEIVRDLLLLHAEGKADQFLADDLDLFDHNQHGKNDRALKQHGHCIMGLEKAWRLHYFVCRLQASDLVLAIVPTIIARSQGLTISKFVAFAKFCCAPGQGFGVGGEDPWGKHIKLYLAQNLKWLDDHGFVEQIKKREGTLKELLIEVLIETYRGKKR